MTALLAESGSQYKAAIARVLPNFMNLLLANREDVTPEMDAAVRAAVAEFLAQIAPAPEPEAETPPG